jgi:hypothetical protein
MFQISKHIKLNMIEEKMTTLGFNKDNPKSSSTFSLINTWLTNQGNTTKGQNLKQKPGDGCISYYMEQGGEHKCWKCCGSHAKKD